MLSTPQPVRATLAHRHGLLEGPRDAGDHWVYADVTGGGVWAVDDQPEPRPVVERRRGIGGLVLHEDGGLVLGGRSLLHVAADGRSQVLLERAEATGVNDLHVLPDGAIVAGLLRFRPMAGEAPVPGLVVRVGVDGTVDVLDDDVLWPNGIGHSPAGDVLYVSDFARRQVVAIPLDGARASVFCELDRGSADGLAVDAQGGVWVALGDGGGIARYRPDGIRDTLVEGPAGFVSSLAFGGPDGREVRITTADNPLTPDTGGTVWAARSAVPGLTVPRARVTLPR